MVIAKHTSLLHCGVGYGANPSLEPNEASFKKMPYLANKYQTRIKYMNIDKHICLVHCYVDLKTYLSVAKIRTLLKMALNFDRTHQTRLKVVGRDKHTSLLNYSVENGSTPNLVPNETTLK